MPDQYGPYRKFRDNFNKLKKELENVKSSLKQHPNDEGLKGLVEGVNRAIEIMEEK